MFKIPLEQLIRIFFVFLFYIFLLRSQESRLVNHWLDRPFSLLASQVVALWSQSVYAVEELWNNYVALVETQKRNRELMLELERIKTYLLDYEEKKNLVRELRHLLKLRDRSPIKFVAAENISSISNLLQETFWIDHGSEDGIQLGQAVLSKDGIIGTIVKTFPKKSQVLLLSDRFSVIDVRISRNSGRGLVEGIGNGRAIFRSFDRADDLREGDELISIGIDEVFPSGIKVGNIEKIAKDTETGLPVAYVKLSYNRFQIRYVLVAVSTSSLSHSFWQDPTFIIDL